MLSIIIPTLNEEKLIASVLDQFTPELKKDFPFEIIISDGGSVDRTLHIAAEYDVAMLRHTERRRQTIAEGRNRGANTATSDVLVFLNADTRFGDTRKFLSEVHRLMRDDLILAATCSVQVFPEEEKLIDRVFHVCHNAYCRLLNLIGEGMGRGECQIIRKELFDRIGKYNEELAAGEDYDLFRRVRRVGKIAFLKNVTLYESPRRFRKYGYMHIVWGWTKNALSVAWKKKSSSEVWEAIR